MFDDLPLFRSADPITSVLGAGEVKPRRRSQAMLLLAEYLHGGMTDEEAGMASGLALKPKCCYWFVVVKIKAHLQPPSLQGALPLLRPSCEPWSNAPLPQQSLVTGDDAQTQTVSRLSWLTCCLGLRVHPR
jgi:hypothetical protein